MTYQQDFLQKYDILSVLFVNEGKTFYQFLWCSGNKVKFKKGRSNLQLIKVGARLALQYFYEVKSS